MSKFTVTIDTDNDDFVDDFGFEVARILRKIAARVEGGYGSGKVLDTNGNSVGSFEHDES